MADKKLCKEKLYNYLKEQFGNIEKEKKFDWCTSHSATGKYDNIIQSISSYRHSDFIPERVSLLPCDYVCEKEKLIIEYDEVQHFTVQRKISLEAYPDDVFLNYDKTVWLKLCEKYQRKMDKKTDPYRDEKRALYDSIRDLIMPEHGYKLIRIYHDQIDFENPNARDVLITLIRQAV